MTPEELKITLQSPVAFHRVFKILGGSATAGLMLSQAFYWAQSPTVIKRNGWFWKTQEEWEAETGLTRYEQETARKNLIQRGLMAEKLKGHPAKLHYKLNLDMIS